MQLPLQQSVLDVQAQLFGWHMPASTWQVLLAWQTPLDEQTLPAEQTPFEQQGCPG